MLRETIEALCIARLGRWPNLDQPQGYNDLIQWLKLYDQRPDHIVCCDKWAVRDWVAERAGEDVLIPATLDWPPIRLPAVAKCTHDSGSARLIAKDSELPRALEKLNTRCARKYGAEKGEWAYQYVAPRIMVEDVMPGPIVDYKFHCAEGRIKWCQVVADRASGKAKETILSPEGRVLPLHMDHKMVHVPSQLAYPGDEAWSKLGQLTERLAWGWRYVRVDLYWAWGRALFGEMTFWPLAGCYMTKDEPMFGEMLGLDLSYRFNPIVQ